MLFPMLASLTHPFLLMSHSSTPLRFGVIGNPIAHSRSPAIHAQFAQQAGLSLSYERILAPLDDFTTCCMDFFQQQGGKGLNVTVPFKEQAYQLAAHNLSPRARHAAAVNTLWQDEHGAIHGCNTDGIGLCTDLIRLGHAPEGKKILLIGAGGAARGVLFPLLEQGCQQVHIINRTRSRAAALHTNLAEHAPEYSHRVSTGGLEDHAGDWDIVINASSSSMSAHAPDLPLVRFTTQALAYDMYYADRPTAFMLSCSAAPHRSDGLGMLVAQAAASFEIWNGYKPNIVPVLEHLRAQLAAEHR